MTGAGQEKTQYCLSCGEDVPIYRAEVEGRAEVRCAYCGFTLGTAQTASDVALECIVLADDDLFFRNLLSDILTEERLVQEVIACDSGAALLTECVRRFHAQRPIALVILDILMAPIDGSAAALALRALERGFELPTPVPILFLSGVRADDSLRQVTQDCAPALYLNKGKDVSSPQLARRIKDLIPRVLASGRAG